MLNLIIIQGRLTKDPELRRTGSGLAVANFSVAVERDFPDKTTGQRETDFINCVAWREKGEFVGKYFKKGSMIVVSGRLQMRNWTDDNGVKRTIAEIVADNVYFGESKKDRDAREGAGNPYGAIPFNPYVSPYAPPYAVPNNPGYSAPADPTVPAPASDFAMLEDDDAMLPF